MIINNVQLWYVQCDPKRPNARLNKKNPTWEVQCRTTDFEQKKEWEAAGLPVKLMVHKAGTEKEGEPYLTEDGKKQWRMNLKKRSLTAKGEPAKPVIVVNGSLEEVDPNTIGNKSLANLRIYQYPYKKADETDGLAAVIMAIQLVRHIKYTPKPGESFEMFETEEVESDEPEHAGDESPSVPKTETKPTPKAPTVKPKDERPEEAF